MTDQSALHIVITGNPVDGFTYHGPFADFDAASDWTEGESAADCDWWIAPLEAVAPIAGISATLAMQAALEGVRQWHEGSQAGDDFPGGLFESVQAALDFAPPIAEPSPPIPAAHDPAACPSNHNNGGDDICTDCGADLNGCEGQAETNRHRLNRARDMRAAWLAYERMAAPISMVKPRDILADLMHLCAVEGVDFGHELSMATDFFSEES